MHATPPAAAGRPRKKGLLLFPEFPPNSFWSYHYILRLIGRKATFPPFGLVTFAALLPDDNITLFGRQVCSHRISLALKRRRITGTSRPERRPRWRENGRRR